MARLFLVKGTKASVCPPTGWRVSNDELRVLPELLEGVLPRVRSGRCGCHPKGNHSGLDLTTPMEWGIGRKGTVWSHKASWRS